MRQKEYQEPQNRRLVHTEKQQQQRQPEQHHGPQTDLEQMQPAGVSPGSRESWTGSRETDGNQKF